MLSSEVSLSCSSSGSEGRFLQRSITQEQDLPQGVFCLWHEQLPLMHPVSLQEYNRPFMKTFQRLSTLKFSMMFKELKNSQKLFITHFSNHIHLHNTKQKMCYFMHFDAS